MITKALAILALTILGLWFAHTILTNQPPKQAEYEEYGAYFFNQ